MSVTAPRTRLRVGKVGEHLTERRDHAMRLWALLTLEWWLRSERAPTVA